MKIPDFALRVSVAPVGADNASITVDVRRTDTDAIVESQQEIVALSVNPQMTLLSRLRALTKEVVSKASEPEGVGLVFRVASK